MLCFGLRVLIVAALVLVVDGVWLRLRRAMYQRTIRNVQKKELRVRMCGAVWSYACIIFLIVWVSELIGDSPLAALYGFLLGFAVYGVFNGTNRAIFRDYDTRTAVVDSLWGGAIFALAFWVYSIMV